MEFSTGENIRDTNYGFQSACNAENLPNFVFMVTTFRYLFRFLKVLICLYNRDLL